MIPHDKIILSLAVPQVCWTSILVDWRHWAGVKIIANMFSLIPFQVCAKVKVTKFGPAHCGQSYSKLLMPRKNRNVGDHVQQPLLDISSEYSSRHFVDQELSIFAVSVE